MDYAPSQPLAAQLKLGRQVAFVKYSDGNEARLGDYVAISGTYRGVVVACMDRDEYDEEHPREQWSYLGKGMLVNTDFGGLVHYEDGSDDHFALISRVNEV